MASLQDRLNKLKTLEEDLENVSIQDITHNQRTMKRSPSAQYFQQQPSYQTAHGLGLSVPPRRPSDNMLKKNPKLTILERPVSNDSITSTTIFSEYSEDINDSRNSSITSGSIGCSPITKTINNYSTSSIDQTNPHSESPHPRLKHAMSTPKLFPYHQRPSTVPSSNLSTSQLTNVSTTSLSTLRLTPSQKLRLKRQNSKSSSKSSVISEREKYYDLNSDDDDTIEDGLIWNVPYTRGSANIFNPASGANPHLIKNIIEQSPVTMPMSPLPGSTSAPVSPMVHSNGNGNGNGNGGFYKLADESQSISQFYQASSASYAKQEVENRKKSSLNLPVMIKQASTLGLDDLKLVSEEKAKSLTSTRPIWLPPKPSKECLKHEKDVSKMLEKAAKMDKLKQEQHQKEIKLQEQNKTKWMELAKKDATRNSIQSEMKKICLKTKIPHHLRYEIWCAFLNKSKTSEDEIETFDELNTKLSTLPELPSTKIQELNDLIKDVYPTLGSYPNQSELNSKLLKLLKLLMVSKISLVPKFDEYLLGILLLKFNEVDSFNLFYLIKTFVFSETLMTKFDTNLLRNSVISRQLKDKEFKSDLDELASSIIMRIIANINDLDIVYHFFDIFILNTNYKVLYCLVLTVLKNYHFGFNDLNELISEDNKNVKVNISDPVQFCEKFNHYYKKFF